MIRMAVCMFGCWRTGDRTLDYIKKFFDLHNIGIEVDFFCSVKAYDQYFNMGEGELSEPMLLTEEQHNHIHNTLTNKLKPKKINFINDLGMNLTQIKLSSMIDSVFLKKQYEEENDIKYDITFLYRYDVLINHYGFLESLMYNWLHDDNTKILFEHNNILKPRDIIFCDTLTSVWKPDNNMSKYIGAEYMWSGISVYEDLLLFGTGNAVDRIIYEFLHLVRQNHSAQWALNDIEGHYALAHAIRNAHVTRLSIPRIRSDGGAIWIEGFSSPHMDLTHYHHGQPIILRPTYEWQDDDDIFSFETINRITARANT